MRLEIDIPEHHYNNIMALDSVRLGRVPYKGIIMYTINAIKHGKVLEQEPTTKNDLGVDCISREQALVAIRNLYPSLPRVDFNGSLRKWVDKYKPYIECDDAIKELPSVTPQEPKIFPIAEIKYDKDKLKELVNKAVLTVAPQEPQIFKWCDTCREYDQEKHCCHRWSKVIRDTVEEMKQEPRKGHWIDTNDDGFVYHRIYKCSHCGATVCEYPENMHESKYNYCSSCGAKMVEPQESEAEDGECI